MTVNTTMRKSVVRVAAAVALMGSCALSLSACNATRGFGQDVSSVGHDMSHGANNAQNSIQKNTGAAPN